MLSESTGCRGKEHIGKIDYHGITVNVELCPHAVDNLDRPDNIGPPITRAEIMRMCRKAVPKIMTALLEWDIQLADEFLITSTKSHVNLPATIESVPGKERTYEIRGITTMRKPGFRPKYGDKQFKVMSEWLIKTFNQEMERALSNMYQIKV